MVAIKLLLYWEEKRKIKVNNGMLSIIQTGKKNVGFCFGKYTALLVIHSKSSFAEMKV